MHTLGFLIPQSNKHQLREGEKGEEVALSRTNPIALNLSLEWSMNPWGERKGRRVFFKLT
jgi:hypothetical protein